MQEGNLWSQGKNEPETIPALARRIFTCGAGLQPFVYLWLEASPASLTVLALLSLWARGQQLPALMEGMARIH